MKFCFTKALWITSGVFKYSARPDADPMSPNRYGNSNSGDKDRHKDKTAERIEVATEAAEIWDILGEPRFESIRPYFAMSDFVPKTVQYIASVRV